MPAAELSALLFVFLLATFIGLGVVTRVSRLLHTPLMSLTNAISAIAVVGSIVIAGQDHPPARSRLLGAIALAASMTNIVSGFLITDRMLRHVQEARRGEAAMSFWLDRGRVPRRLGALRPVAALDERPEDRAQGRPCRRGRDDARHPRARSSTPGIVQLGLDRGRRGRGGFVIGVPLSWVPLTAVPQRTAVSHAFGGLAAGLVGTAKFYLWQGEPENLTAFRTFAIVAEVILGFLTFTGSLMAAGKLQEVRFIPQRPVTYPLQNLTNIGLLVVAFGCGVALVFQPVALRVPVPRDRRARARLRRAADHPDRRRRHADRDLAAQLVRRPVGGGDGLRARQQAAGDRGRARRQLGPDPLDHHVPRDEPLVHQRAVRRVRPGAARRRAPSRRARPSARRPRVPRRCSRWRAGS